MSLTESLASSFGLAHAYNVKTAIEKSPQNKDIFLYIIPIISLSWHVYCIMKYPLRLLEIWISSLFLCYNKVTIVKNGE